MSYQISAAGPRVAVIDSSLRDFQSLVGSAEALGMEVILISPQSHGLKVLTEELEGMSNISSLHIFSHGSNASVQLGVDDLNPHSLNEHREALEAIRDHLGDNADILLYGCDIAEGEEGKQLLIELADLTQADVAASDDRTGIGGDWDLEITQGEVEQLDESQLISFAHYDHNLATLTVANGNNDGAGSLRQALADAVSGDTITFDPSVTNVSISETLTIGKNLTIDGDLDNNGTPDVTIDAGFNSGVIQVGYFGVVNATIDGLVITGGLVSGRGGQGANSNGGLGSYNGGAALGAGITVGYFYATTLTLLNSSVVSNVAAAGGAGSAVTGGSSYGGGGGGGFNGTGGGTGGSGLYFGSSSGSGVVGPTNGGGGIGGHGGGRGGAANAGNGGSTVGGAGGDGGLGGTGGTASVGSASVGGGGAGSGTGVSFGAGGQVGGIGGNAVGGIYVDSNSTLYMANTTISNNLAAGGGGSRNQNGGFGAGAIGIAGSLNYQSSTVTISSNDGAGGLGGSGGSTGASVDNSVYLIASGTVNDSWAPPSTNTAPVFTASNNGSVDETAANGTVVLADADIEANDGDGGATDSSVSYAISSGNPNGDGDANPAFAINAEGVVTVNDADDLDHEANDSIVLTIQANDGESSNNTATTDVTITINDVAPAITPDQTFSANESDADTTSLGTVAVTGDDDSIVYSIESGNSGSAFAINSATGELTVNDSTQLDASTTPSYSLAIRASDGTTNSDVNVTIDVTDDLAPAVSSVSSTTDNGSYRAGQSIDITIQFDEAVTVTGTPQLTLETGATDRVVDYLGLSGGDTLRFTYTIQAGDTAADLDYVSSSALALNSGTIRDAVGNDATLTLPNPGAANSLGANKALVVDTTVPTVTDANISISGASGTGGVYRIGDTATATWNDTAGGDNNGDIGSVTVDFSAFGGGAAVAASNSSGTWTAAYVITSGVIDATNLNVSVTATDNAGHVTTTADTTNASLDSVAPTVTDGNLGISGATGTGGVYRVGDTVTVAWDNTAGGDNNTDTIAGVTVDFSSFGGGAAVLASNSGDTWTATYTITAGTVDAGNLNVSVTATDNAGNATTIADSTGATVDNQPPTITDGNISLSGATGAGGVFKIGDTVTATWNNTAGGDNNSDISSATLDFSAFGGGAAVAAVNNSGTWTATYTIIAGSIDATNLNVALTATDNAGNATTTSDTTNAVVNNLAPTVTDGNISISGASGTGGAFVAGDTVTATWNNTAGGDNNSDIGSVTLDFSAFGGGSAVAASDSADTWTATYTLVAGSIDATNVNVSVTAASNSGNATTTADTTNATVDTEVPTVTDGNTSIAGASGIGGVYRVGDTITATWNNTAGGDNNADIAGATVDFSAFGGAAAVAASNSGDIWTATFTLTGGVLDTTNLNVSVTATDDAGGGTTTADSTDATVDNEAPTVTDESISISGATGPGGAFTIGDTVTATWNNTAVGDNNADTISGVTVDFSAFPGGDAAVMASENAGVWTASYTIVAGAIDSTEVNVSVTATDDAGNATTTADTTNATVFADPPTVTDENISISGASGTDGIYKIGDTVTATWDNSVDGDNNEEIGEATFSFSAFGGGSAVAATNADGVWTATYTIRSGNIDATSRNVLVTATNDLGISTTVADTTDATVDNRAPRVTDRYITLSGEATGTSGIYIIGDTVTATWDNTAGGDDNNDISEATVDFSAFGGGLAVAATNSGGSWSASYTLVTGTIDGTDVNVSMAATDDAGNTTSTADTTNVDVDNQPPTVTDGNISINSGSGVGGVFVAGDAVTATWDNSSLGDNSPFTISGATVDFSAFGGDAAATAVQRGQIWEASFTLASGSLDATDVNVTVTATDEVGNTATAADTTDAAIDTQAPTVTDGSISLSGGSGTEGVFIAGDTITVTWDNTASGDNNADVSAATVDFSELGGGASVAAMNSSGLWTATFTLDAGSISATDVNVSVTATDDAGNTTTATDSTNATVDAQAPVAPAIPDLDAASDTGASDSDDLTSDTTPTFSGTGEDGATVTLFADANDDGVVDAGESLGTAVVSGGAWSITASALADDTYNIRSIQTDTAGNTSAASASLVTTILTTIAAPGAPDLDAASDTGASDDITSDTTPTFSGTGEDGATVTLFADANDDGVVDVGESLGTAVVSGGVWSITSSALEDGAYNIRSIQTDTAGNTSAASAVLATTIDTTIAAPGAPDLDAASDTGASDDITSDTTPTFSGTGEDAATVTLFADANDDGVVDAGESLGTAVVSGGVWSITSSALEDGAYNIRSIQTDTAGNTSAASAVLATTIDTTIAAPGAPDLDAASDTGVSDSDDITSDTTPAFSGTGEDAATVTLFADANDDRVVDAGESLGTAVVSGGVWSITSSALEDGAYNIRSIQTDTAGNTSAASAVLATTIDTTIAAPGAPDLDAASDTGVSDSDDITSGTTPAFSGTGEDAATVTLFADANDDGVVDAGESLGTAVVSGGVWSITSSALEDGAYNIRSIQTDTAGNTSAASAALVTTILTVIAAPGAPDLDAASDTGASDSDDITSDTTPAFSGTGEDAATVTLFADANDDGVVDAGESLGTAVVSGGVWSITASGLTDDTYNVRSIQTDTAGNTSAASAVLATTIDTTIAAPGAPDLDAASDTGASDSDDLTSDTTPTFSGAGEDAATVTLFADANDDGCVGCGGKPGHGGGVGRRHGRLPRVRLADDTYNIRSIQTDTAGNTSAASAVTGSLQSTPAIAAPGAPDLDAASDTGASDSDDLTSDTTPTFSGTGEDAATVTLFADANDDGLLDAGESLGTAVVSGGAWSITASALADDTYNIRSIQTDTAGNTSAASAVLATTIDTAIAAPGAPDLDAASDTGASDSDDLTSDTTPTFSGAGEDAATVTLFADANDDGVVDAGESLGTAVVSGGVWSITSSVLADGSYSIRALQTDTAGNSAASATLAVSIDADLEADSDGDEIDDSVEDGVPPVQPDGSVGDGNGDGVPDRGQRDVTSVIVRNTDQVSSEPDAQGVYVTLVGGTQAGGGDEGLEPSGGFEITSVQQLDAPLDRPDDIEMPLGLLSFEATTPDEIDEARFSLLIDSAIPVNGFWKEVSDGEWVNLASPEFGGSVTAVGDKTRLDFVILDNGPFDLNPATGAITDPGAPGFRSEPVDGEPCPFKPFQPDTDGDGIPDEREVELGLDVQVKDNDVFGNTVRFVEQLYRDLLWREGETGGVDYWTDRLESASLSEAEVLDRFLRSPEFSEGAGLILSFYQGVLGRSADACGLDYWMAQFNAGVPVESIATRMLSSVEFTDQFGVLDSSAVITTLFAEVLDRTPSAEEFDQWSGALGNGALRGELLISLVQSDEYEARSDDSLLLDALYLGNLDRGPDRVGYEWWQSRLDEGQQPLDVIGSFLDSPEYHERFLPPQVEESAETATFLELLGVSDVFV